MITGLKRWKMETENKPSSTPQSINDLSAPNNENEIFSQETKISSTLKIAGILLLLVGVLIIVHWVYITVTPNFIDTLLSTGVYDNMNITRADLEAVFNFCGILAVGLSLFTIIGGILALQRKTFWFAVIGGILGIFAIAPLFFFLPNILSLLGVILVIRSRREFR
jgi:uncharacterized membrane protein YdcZ (DUF606 family)